MFGVISSCLHLWWKNIPTIPGMTRISRTNFSRQGDVALRRFRAPFRCEASCASSLCFYAPLRMVNHGIWGCFMFRQSRSNHQLTEGKKRLHHFDPSPCVSTISSQSDNWLKWSQIGNASSFTQGNSMISTVPFVHWQNTLSTSCAFEQQTILCTIGVSPPPLDDLVRFCTTLHHFAPNHTLNCARRGTCIRRPSIYQTKVGMYPIISQKKNW